MSKPGFRGDITKTPLAKISIKDALFGTIPFKMGCKGFDVRQVKTTGAFLFQREFANVSDKEIQQTIIVEVKEHDARTVAGVIDAGGNRNILEFAGPVVSEKAVSHADSGYKEIGI